MTLTTQVSPHSSHRAGLEGNYAGFLRPDMWDDWKHYRNAKIKPVLQAWRMRVRSWFGM